MNDVEGFELKTSVYGELKKFFKNTLKALFNNVSTLKRNLSCMVLHAISVFDKV